MNETFAALSDAIPAARNGIVDIVVAPGAAELRVEARANPYRPYEAFLTIMARLGAGAVLAGLTALFMALMQPAADTVERAGTALAGAVVGIAAFRFAVEHQWKRRLARHVVGRRDPYRFVGDGRSLSIEDEHGLLRVNLDGLRQVVETPSHLIIIHRFAPVLALPRKAFARPEIAKAFADFLRRQIDSEAGQPPESRHE